MVFLAFAAATMLQGTGAFHYDAEHYWNAALALVGSPAAPDGFWEIQGVLPPVIFAEMRGILTPVVFAPAAALTLILGPDFAGFSVLVQNSLVLAALAAFLVPMLMSGWRVVTTTMRWVAAFAVWVVTSGFAPFSLLDIYPVIAILAAIVLLRSTQWLPLLLAGVACGVAINLRPSYLIVVGLIVLAAAAWRRWGSLVVLAGVGIAMIPQVLLNRIQFGEWSLLPVESDSLVALQAGYASYTVRYDTVLGAESARQFYCFPDMARLVADAPPESSSALVLAFLENLPVSFLFALHKIGAAIHWPLTTPYAIPTRGLDTLFGVAVAVATVVGISVILFYAARRARTGNGNWFEFAVITAVVFGVMLTLVSAATENRFALPIVLIGAVGCATITQSSVRTAWEKHRWWVIATGAVTVLVVFLGITGLDHPAPRGDVNASLCASL